jgi:hypothetical protein
VSGILASLLFNFVVMWPSRLVRIVRSRSPQASELRDRVFSLPVDGINVFMYEATNPQQEHKAISLINELWYSFVS